MALVRSVIALLLCACTVHVAAETKQITEATRLLVEEFAATVPNTRTPKNPPALRLNEITVCERV